MLYLHACELCSCRNMKTQITFKRIHPNISLIAKKKERLMTEQDGQKNLNLAFTKYFCENSIQFFDIVQSSDPEFI